MVKEMLMDDQGESADYWMSDRVTAATALAKRATWLDRWHAWRNPNHWLSDARRTLMVAKHGLVYCCRHRTSPTPCIRCFGKHYDPETPARRLG